jgi:hypothetical protein
MMLTTIALAAGLLVAPAGQAPQSVERVILAGSAKIDRIDISTRMVTLRTDDNRLHSVYVDRALKSFDQLKVGDVVKVRVVDAVVVAVARNAKPSMVADTTAAARKASSDGTEVLQQLKAVVTIESVDLNTQTVVYKLANSQSVTRYAVDRHLIEHLKKGDVVEITYTRERAVEIEKQ